MYYKYYKGKVTGLMISTGMIILSFISGSNNLKVEIFTGLHHSKIQTYFSNSCFACIFLEV